VHLIKWRNIILDFHDLRNIRKNTARGIAVSGLRGGCVWGLVLSTVEAAERDEGEDRGGDGGEGRGEVGREIEVEDGGDDKENENGSSSDDNNDDSDSDDGSCREVKSAEQGHAFQNSSSSSGTALKGSTVPTGSTVHVSNNRNHHHHQKEKRRKERLMVDEEGMRGVCQTFLSVMGRSLSLESSVIYGLRREGGASE
jgi:hypothetical protein